MPIRLHSIRILDPSSGSHIGSALTLLCAAALLMSGPASAIASDNATDTKAPAAPSPFPAPYFKHFPACTEFEAVVPIIRVATGSVIHRFFNSSPISPSGRYLALFRLPSEDRTPKPGETGEVVLVDLYEGTERVIATSCGWETQLGANVQWGISDEELYYNDVDVSTWTPFAVQHNPLTGKTRKLEGTVFAVSPDGTQLASYNLGSSRRIQEGYGVVLPEDRRTRNQGPVKDDGIYLTDVASGKCRLIASLHDIVEKAVPALDIESPEEYEFYGFQVSWNPAGTRLMTFVRWTKIAVKGDGSKVRAGSAIRRLALITMRPDGSDIRVAINAEQYKRGGHHPSWTPNSEEILINLNITEGPRHLDLVQVRYDGTNLRSVYHTGSGHPSMHPEKPFVITDAYPQERISPRDGTAPLRFIDLKNQREIRLAKVSLTRKTPEKLHSEFRVDAHPAWDRSGRFVVFNGVYQNSRAVFIADLGQLLTESSTPSPAKEE